MVSLACKVGRVITLVLLAALALPPQQSSTTSEEKAPVTPEQVLAWQLEGLTQEEIREEVTKHGLTECPDEALLNALSAAGADAETISAIRKLHAPGKLWKLGLRLPSPTDYLYEMAGAVLWSDWEHAVQTMQMEVEKQPGNPDVRLIYAHVLRMQEDWIAAYGQATEAVHLAPQSAYAHAQRSTMCYYSRLEQCAMREALTFVSLRPQDAAAYIILGHAEELLGNDAEALQAYTEAKRLHAGYSEIDAGLGRVYEREGQFEKAVAAVEEAIRMDAKKAEYYRELAQIYLVEGYIHKAIEVLQQAKQLEPERPEILLELGNAYLADEHYPEAIREYRELLDEAPDAEVARSQLAKALRADGREAEAEQVYTEPLVAPGTKKQQ